MKGIWWAIVCLAMIVPCQAEEQPKLELFSGYSYMHSGLTGGGQDHPKLNGWDASLARNVNSWFSMKADFGGHYGSTDVQVPIPVTICPPACLPPISVNTNTHEFLFGPQFTYRTRTARVFAHTLIGAEHVSVNSRLAIPFPVPPLTVSRAETGFATAIGGGIDLGSGRLAVRFQPDLVITHLFNRTQYDPRVGVGVVVRF